MTMERLQGRWMPLLAGGFALGVLVTGGSNYAWHETGTNEFCIACHANDAAKEWRESVHYGNPAGVAAGCADCHLPRAFVPRLLRKAKGATVEVWAHFAGTIATPGKYEARRRAMAETEWRRLRADGAQECRDCHRPEAMVDKDKREVGAMHAAAVAGGQICTDCHQGVAHVAPSAAYK